MTYENAPATKMVATHCAACARPLLDATSVETGMGPECRKRHGYNKPDIQVDLEHACAVAKLAPEHLRDRLFACDTVREMANIVVHRIALEQDGPEVNHLTNLLAALGYTKLAARIIERTVAVRIELDGTDYVVRTPYSEQAAAGFRSLPYAERIWDSQIKAWRVRGTAKPALWGMLQRCFRGATAVGPKGMFTL